MLALFVTVAKAPVANTPKPPPEMEPPALLVTLPPPPRSTPAPVVEVAVMLPLFVTVPDAPVFT